MQHGHFAKTSHSRITTIMVAGALAWGCSSSSSGDPGEVPGKTQDSGGSSGHSGTTLSQQGGTAPGSGSLALGGATELGTVPEAGGSSASGGTWAVGGSVVTAVGGTQSSGGSTARGGSSAAVVGGTTGKGGQGTQAGGSSSAGGKTASGGSSAVGGTWATGGTSTEGPCSDPSKVTWTGAATRPLLSDATAPCFTAKRYLRDWDPTGGLPAASSLIPTFTVAADGSGTHTSVQAAVNAAKGTSRVYILVKPGKYRETVCVKGTTPVTLYGAGSSVADVTIAYDNVNGRAVNGRLVNECQPASGTFGTTNSSVVFVKSNDFQAMNLTIENDYAEPGNVTAQAVAMTTTGDKAQFQNVRFIGNQDTLQPGSSAPTTVARSYYQSCKIEGDTDFIFGNGTAVFDRCEITYIGTRKTGGVHFAPSTDQSNPYGLLIVRSHIIAGTGSKAGAARLGRAWDVSGQPTSNGQVVVRESQIDNHVISVEPWGASTSGRAFSANGNRFFEYKNTGGGAAK